MTRDGFKRAVVMGLAASALFLAGGCRDERGRQGPQYVPSQQQEQGTGGAGQSGQQPVDVNPQPDQEGFKTVPEQQELPSGIQDESRGQGGSGQERSVDVNPLPEEEGFQSVPERQELPHGVGEDPERRKDAQ